MTKRERAIKRAIAKAHTVPDNHIVVVNRNLASDYSRARAKHSTNHGTCVRFLESRDASGADIRTLPVVALPHSLVHPVGLPS